MRFARFKWPPIYGEYAHEIQIQGVGTASERERLRAVADTRRAVSGVVFLAGLGPDRCHSCGRGDDRSGRRCGPPADLLPRPPGQAAARTRARRLHHRCRPALRTDLWLGVAVERKAALLRLFRDRAATRAGIRYRRPGI